MIDIIKQTLNVNLQIRLIQNKWPKVFSKIWSTQNELSELQVQGVLKSWFFFEVMLRDLDTRRVACVMECVDDL